MSEERPLMTKWSDRKKELFISDIPKRRALRSCRVATKEDWITWLDDYCYSNNISDPFTHIHDYPFSRFGSFYVAETEFTLPALYGSSMIHLIVPEHLTVHADDLGHNDLYYHGNPPTTSPDAIIPYFSDLG